MKGYLGIFRMRLIAGMQYRVAAWAGVATQFFWGFIQLMIFAAFYHSSGSQAQPMPFAAVADYVWLRQAFLALLMLWSQDMTLLDHIASGHVGYELCRPYRLYPFWFARLTATRLAATALRFLPILLVTSLLPGEYGFNAPPSWSALGLFVLTLTLALGLVVAMSMFIYLLTFITLSPNGARLLIGAAGEFLMGAIIPIPFMPEVLQTILKALPFRYMADFPFRVYSGGIVGGEALYGIIVQLIWLVLLIALGILGFAKVQKRIVIQGG